MLARGILPNRHSFPSTPKCTSAPPPRAVPRTRPTASSLPYANATMVTH
uniref:Uncharacterized protein n=1 Tax=Arundo donax TaxID=35708 RepID=A0A0A8ZXR5_ARUDO